MVFSEPMTMVHTDPLLDSIRHCRQLAWQAELSQQSVVRDLKIEILRLRKELISTNHELDLALKEVATLRRQQEMPKQRAVLTESSSPLLRSSSGSLSTAERKKVSLSRHQSVSIAVGANLVESQSARHSLRQIKQSQLQLTWSVLLAATEHLGELKFHSKELAPLLNELKELAPMSELKAVGFNSEKREFYVEFTLNDNHSARRSMVFEKESDIAKITFWCSLNKFQ